VLSGAAEVLAGVAHLQEGLKGEAAFDAFGQKVLDPVLAKVGWDAKPGEDQNVTLLRGALLESLSMLDDKAVIAEADRRFETYVKDRNSLSPDLRRSVLAIVASNATPQIWDQLHSMAKAAKSQMESSELYSMLGLARDPKLVQRALDLSLTDELPVTTRPLTIGAAAYGYHPEMAFDFAVANLDKVNSWLEPDSRNEFEARLAGQSMERSMIQKLKDYADAHVPPTAHASVDKALGQIAYYAGVREKMLPDVDAWLAKNGY